MYAGMVSLLALVLTVPKFFEFDTEYEPSEMSKDKGYQGGTSIAFKVQCILGQNLVKVHLQYPTQIGPMLLICQQGVRQILPWIVLVGHSPFCNPDWTVHKDLHREEQG